MRVQSAASLLVLFGSAVILAQQQPLPTFRASTRLIIETVIVTDKNRKPVEGLTAGDFVVVEDGQPQDIAFVEFQRLDAELPPSPLPSSRALLSPNVASSTQPQIAAPQAGGIQYRDRRLLVLYFDLSAMPPQDQLRAYSNARKFVESQMKPLDTVAVLTFQAGAVRVKQDFTDDKSRLKEVIQALTYGDDQDGDGIPDSILQGSAFGQNEAEFAIFSTDRQLAALQTAVNMLRQLPEQKSLIYFSSGLALNGSDNQAQLRATINAAVRANVLLNPIDARGLVASAPLGDATRSSTGGIGAFTGQLVQHTMSAFQRSQDTLYSLAKDTGGVAMFDYNDLSVGIAEAAKALTSYYIVGYYSTHTATDGKFRRVQVSLRKGLSADVAHRQGYFADKEFTKMSAADKERQLEDALMLDNPITDIPMTMEVNYFQLNRAEYFVPVAVKIPGSELALAKKGGAQRTVIDFIGEIKDRYGNTLQNLRDRLDIKLDNDIATQWATRAIQYETGFTLLPDEYNIKLLARDATTGRIGTFQTTFTIPNLLREQKRLPISSVVLSAQRVPLSEALHNVNEKFASEAFNPLVHNGHKIIPSVTRVFRKGRDLYVFLEAYQRDTSDMRPLVAFVSFYRDDTKVMETAPVPITDGWNQTSKAVPLRFSIPLESLSTGRLDCQVTVLDPGGRKIAFWRAPIVVLP